MSFPIKSFYGKTKNIPPHLRKKPNYTDFQTEFDSSDMEDDLEQDEAAQISSKQEDTIESSSQSEVESEDESLTCSESDGEENIPLADLATNSVKGKVRMAEGQVFRWRKRNPLIVDSTFHGDPFPPPPEEEHSPLTYF